MIELPICYLGNTIDPAWNTTVKVIGPNDDIPLPDSIDNLYLDFETTSEIPNRSSINPHSEEMIDEDMDLHRLCKICGVAFLFDSDPSPYYIPVRHYYLDEDEEICYRSGPFSNVRPDKVHDWLRKVMGIAKRWTNHNIKYDFHVLYNETGIVPKSKLICTIILSKLAQFQERFSYGLDEVTKLLGVDITPYEKEIHTYLGRSNKDYGLIPPDKMAVYAGVDVLAVRFLTRELRKIISATTGRVEELEMNLLPVLIQMEQIGCRVDIKKLKYDFERISKLQIIREERIKKYADEPNFIISGEGTKKSHYDLFVEKLGFDLDYTDTSIKKLEKGLISEEEATFSFGGDSIRKNASKNPRLVASYLAYIDDAKLFNSYIKPYILSHVNGKELIHCNVNQQVRTGRMSVTSPGMQTLPPKAKYYIIPYTDDYVLVEFDLSQIEFRVIAHYINNRKVIDDYNRDPTIDFHTWVAEMCRIHRKPAKNVNFMLGYGGGKEKCVKMLSVEPKIIAELKTREEVMARAYEVYKTYHNVLPELKPTSRRASEVLRSRGYVRTLLGRERHLPKVAHFKAFNSVCQGSAADIQKDITLRLRKFISSDCILHMLVHDSWLFSIRKERVNELVPEIKYEIERPIEDVEFQVPIISDFGISEHCWRLCDS